VTGRRSLVRHGESLHKADGVIGGLTPLGQEQAGALASVLADQDLAERPDPRSTMTEMMPG
jgi:broad specificity phosphatase PhoE